MESVEVYKNLTLAFEVAVNSLVEGVMEGGSRLRLLLKILRNCLESNASQKVKSNFLVQSDLLNNLPEFLFVISNNKTVPDTWYSACLIDILEVLLKIVDIIETKEITGLIKCFKSIPSCFSYPSDKQQKVKTVFLKVLTKLSLLLMSCDERVNSKLLDYDIINQLLMTAAKSLNKIHSLLGYIYEIVYNLISSKESYYLLFQGEMEKGSHQWFLESLTKDILHKKSNRHSIKILLNLPESQKIVNILRKHCFDFIALIPNTSIEEIKIDLLSFTASLISRGDLLLGDCR